MITNNDIQPRKIVVSRALLAGDNICHRGVSHAHGQPITTQSVWSEI